VIKDHRASQRGQVLVVAAAVLAFLFVPLAVLIVDTGLVEAGYAQLGETLQASAEAGASMVDDRALRSSNGSNVDLDPSQARATAEHAVDVSGMPHLESRNVTVHGNTVTVSARARIKLLIFGSLELSGTRSASFVHGR
jgi:hypothetical protein